MRFLLSYLLMLCLCVSALAQDNLPEVAPGLRIPNGSGAIPLALDRFNGVAELVPIHHSTVEVNNHTGANLAGSLAGSFFYKPKVTTELAGTEARTRLHSLQPSIFIHVLVDPDSTADSANSDTSQWALVSATVKKDRRVFTKIRFTQLTGHAQRAEGVVETETETLAGGWLKLTPLTLLEPGEYAVMPVPRAANTFASTIFDFAIDPAAPNSNSAVMAKP
jgi:hypothetical protein